VCARPVALHRVYVLGLPQLHAPSGEVREPRLQRALHRRLLLVRHRMAERRWVGGGGREPGGRRGWWRG